jgi:hypothetical protein
MIVCWIAPGHATLSSFCLETPAEAAPTPVLSGAEGPPDAGRGSPARWFPGKNYLVRMKHDFRKIVWVGICGS